MVIRLKSRQYKKRRKWGTPRMRFINTLESLWHRMTMSRASEARTKLIGKFTPF
jgi:hypothetical protein